MTDSDRIPIRLTPIRGESFDGWLEAYAQRLRVSTTQLGRALGLPPELLRLHSAKIGVAAVPMDAELFAARACGLDPAAIEVIWAGLARYDRLVLECLGAGSFARAMRPLAWSRFCPACLGENGGRWLTAWRIPWHLACPTHETWLSSVCAHCGGVQRDGVLRADRTASMTTRCSCRISATRGRLANRCAHDLTADRSSTPIPLGLIAIQNELVGALDPTMRDNDVARLVGQILDVLTVAAHLGLDVSALASKRLNSPAALASPLVHAHEALANPSGRRMRDLANNDGIPRPTALPPTWRRASPALITAVLRYRDTGLRATDRLRYRSVTEAGRRPEGADPSDRLRVMPVALWPDWAIRLRPPGIDASTFRAAAAAALCLPGATAPMREITRLWPPTQRKLNLSRVCTLVASDFHGASTLGALCVLADQLDRGGTPINYGRRRLFASEIEVLDAGAWTSMCRAAGTPTGGMFRLRAARLWLWEMLTGGMAEQAPAHLRLDSKQQLATYQRFAIDLAEPINRRLREHARGLLRTHGCEHEPLTWSPSLPTARSRRPASIPTR